MTTSVMTPAMVSPSMVSPADMSRTGHTVEVTATTMAPAMAVAESQTDDAEQEQVTQDVS